MRTSRAVSMIFILNPSHSSKYISINRLLSVGKYLYHHHPGNLLNIASYVTLSCISFSSHSLSNTYFPHIISHFFPFHSYH